MTMKALPLSPVASTLLLACALSCAALAEAPPPTPHSLEEMLELALANNPDLRVARARLDEARATLQRTELEVTRDTITLFHQQQRQLELVDTLHVARERAVTLYETGVLTDEEVHKATAALVEARALLETLEADARYVLGLGHPVDPREPTDAPEPAMPQQLPEAMRKALETTLSVDFQDVTLGETLAFLGQATGLTFITAPSMQPLLSEPVSLSMGEVPARSILTALSDLNGLVFVLRDYGLLLSTRQEASMMAAETIPLLRRAAPDRNRDPRRR